MIILRWEHKLVQLTISHDDNIDTTQMRKDDRYEILPEDRADAGGLYDTPL